MKVIILMFCLLVTIESSLRVSEFYKPNFAMSFGKGNQTKVLFLGDSILSSIPEEFEKIIQNTLNIKNTVVFKEAIPSAKIFNIYKNLPEYIKKYSPDITITLLGKSDSTSHEESTEIDFLKHKSMFRIVDITCFVFDAFKKKVESFYLNINGLYQASPSEDLDNNQGLKLYNAGQFQESIDWYKAEIQKKPTEYSFLTMISEPLLKLSRFKEAENFLLKYIEQNPDDIESYNPLIYSLASQNEYEQALFFGEKAHKLDPNNKIIILRNLETLLHTNYPEKVNFYLEKLRHVAPDSFELCENEGNFLIKSEHWAEAIKHFKTCLRFNQSKAQIYDNIAASAMKVNDYKLSLKSYKSAILNDFQSQPRHANAILYGIRMHQFSDLKKFYLDELTPQQRQEPALQGSLARIYLEIEEFETSFNHLKIALKNYPHVDTTLKLAELFKSRNPDYINRIDSLLVKSKSNYRDVLFELYPKLSNKIRSNGSHHVVLLYPDRYLDNYNSIAFNNKDELIFIDLLETYTRSNNKESFFDNDQSHLTTIGSREAALDILEKTKDLF